MKQRPCHCCGGTGKEIDQLALGAELRAERKKCGINLREVARRMGISAAYLSDLERGKRNWREELRQQYREVIFE